MTKDYIHNHYKGNMKTIEDIVDSFKSIFEDDLSNMRYDAYTFNDRDYIYLHTSRQLAEAPMPNNTKPYQKIGASGEDIIEYQMPAYFMQYISFSMGANIDFFTVDFSGLGFLKANFCKKFINSKTALIKKRIFINTPHFLETYYLLIKRIYFNDFN